MNTKKDISANLLKNAEAFITPQSESAASVAISDRITQDTEDDYDLARKKIKDMINVSEDAIGSLAELARQSEHPRAFEVLNQLIKNTSDMAMELSKLQERRKTLHAKQDNAPVNHGDVTNNTIFVGSTTELQKFLRNNEKKVICDAANSE